MLPKELKTQTWNCMQAMSTKLDEIIIDLLRRELGNDADLVIALYDAYKARGGPRGGLRINSMICYQNME